MPTVTIPTHLEPSWLNVSSQSLRVWRGGRKTGPTFVFVHGIGMSGRYLLPLAAELQDEGRVFGLDLPGFGDSPRPKASLDVPGYARVVRAALAAEGLTREIIFIAHSMGCQVVLELLRSDESGVLGAVLIAPTADKAKRTIPAQAIRLLRDTRHEPASMIAVLLRDYLRCGPRHYFDTLPQMLRHHSEEAIREVSVPLLLLRGEYDPIVPTTWVTYLLDQNNRARSGQIAGAGHAVHFSHPVATATASRAFLRELSS